MREITMIDAKYVKYGLAVILVLQALSILFNAGGALLSLVVLAGLGVAVAEKFGVEVAKVELCEAHVYKHLELGTLLYCDSEQATHTDYKYLGTAKVPCDKVNRCSLA
jgi:hypothetical protein